MELIYGDLPLDKVRVRLTRASIRGLAQELCRAVAINEYILCIDSVDGITPKGVQMLEELQSHFIIFAGARSVKIDRSSFSWNFDKLELKPLARSHSLQLIDRLSHDLRMESPELFRNHIFEQSNGNPRVIDRLSIDIGRNL